MAIWSFILYCLDNLASGFYAGDSIFAQVADLFLLIGFGLLVFKKGWKESWNKWEELVMKGAFFMFLGLFFLTAFFITPFLKNEAEKRARITAETDEQNLKQDLKTASARATSLSDDVEKKLTDFVIAQKNGTTDQSSQITALTASVSTLQQSNQALQHTILDIATNADNSPIEAAVKNLASPIPTPSLSDDKFNEQAAASDVDNSFLRIKAQEIETKEEAQKKAREALQEEAIQTANAYRACAPKFDYIIRTFVECLNIVAQNHNDTVSSSYEKMPSTIPSLNVMPLRFDFHFKSDAMPSFEISIQDCTLDIRSSNNQNSEINAYFIIHPGFDGAPVNDRLDINVTENDKKLFNAETPFRDITLNPSNRDQSIINKGLEIIIGAALQRDGIKPPSLVPDKPASPQ